MLPSEAAYTARRSRAPNDWIPTCELRPWPRSRRRCACQSANSSRRRDMSDSERSGRGAKRPPRGIFERPKDSGVWWVRYCDQDGQLHREKVGPKGLAVKVYAKRKTQVREQRFFPEQPKVWDPPFAERV